jgi:hypothetical protein
MNWVRRLHQALSDKASEFDGQQVELSLSIEGFPARWGRPARRPSAPRKESAMHLPNPVHATAACAALTATRLREAAQAQIVLAFRAHLGGGPEPSDEALALFARLAVSEQRLQRRLAAAVVAAEPAVRSCDEAGGL